jgi:hypothetical protein
LGLRQGFCVRMIECFHFSPNRSPFRIQRSASKAFNDER